LNRDDDDDDDDLDAPDDELATVECRFCRRPIWEEAQRCEHCGNYQTSEGAPMRRPWWLVAGVVACLACIWVWIVSH